MGHEMPNETIGYICGSCEQGFKHFPGAVLPNCPRCGQNRFVSRRPSRRAYWLLLAVPMIGLLAYALWNRLSAPPWTPPPPAAVTPATRP